VIFPKKMKKQKNHSDEVMEMSMEVLDDLLLRHKKLLSNMRGEGVTAEPAIANTNTVPDKIDVAIDAIKVSRTNDTERDFRATDMPVLKEDTSSLKTAEEIAQAFEESLLAARQPDFIDHTYEESESIPSLPIFEDDLKPGDETQKTPKKKPKGKIRQMISAVLFYGFLSAVIASAFIVSRGDKKPIFGYSFMNVLTWSMQSEIPQGSLVLIKDIDLDSIEIGDDITFMKDSETSVTHRVIGITENFEDSGQRGFETQGIENDTPDFEIVLAVNVVGKVVAHIPKIGNGLSWLREHLALAMLFAAGFILLIVLLKGAFKKSPTENKPHTSPSRQNVVGL